MHITAKLMGQFTNYLREVERSAATIEKYSREVAYFVAWLEGRAVSKELTRQYKKQLSGTRSPAGVNGAIAALNAWLIWAGRGEWRLKSLKVQRDAFREERRELTREEYTRLLTAADRRGNKRLRLVMESICATGIRVSELKFFTVEAVRLGRVSVNNKGKIRTVLLPETLQRRLLKYAKEQGMSRGTVFVTKGGKPLDRSNIWRDMKKLCREVGVAESKVFPHNLRHLFARTFYRIEKNIVHLADILGHSSIDTTRRYTLETGENHRRKLERLGLVM